MSFLMGYGFGMAFASAIAILTHIVDLGWGTSAGLLVLGLIFIAKSDYDAKRGKEE